MCAGAVTSSQLLVLTGASAVEEQNVTTNEIARNVNEASRGAAEIAETITRVAEAAAENGEGTRDGHSLKESSSDAFDGFGTDDNLHSGTGPERTLSPVG